MRKIIISLIALLGTSLGHAENITVIKSELNHETSAIQTQNSLVGPRKNYRVNLAKSYFGGGTKCRKWNRFCGK